MLKKKQQIKKNQKKIRYKILKEPFKRLLVIKGKMNKIKIAKAKTITPINLSGMDLNIA
jgi:hypothetical protein